MDMLAATTIRLFIISLFVSKFHRFLAAKYAIVKETL